MTDPRLSFAVVREDPLVELTELRALGIASPRVLTIASGGCTALAIQHAFPDASLLLVDPNPAQHARVEAKVRALADRAPLSRFNVDDDDPAGLCAGGRFEALFRQLRNFLLEFVTDRSTLDAATRGDDTARSAMLASAYWPVAFDLFFSDSMLVATFGPAAVQHGVPGSYPRYFQRAVEEMLEFLGPARNPFLHHLLLGHYREHARPFYLRQTRPPPARFEHLVGRIDDVADFGTFDLLHLSNVLDWAEPAEVSRVASRIAEEMRPGAVLTLRQLNNPRRLETRFPGVHFDLDRCERVAASETSNFYNRVLVGTKS